MKRKGNGAVHGGLLNDKQDSTSSPVAMAARKIVGIHWGHNAAAALLCDGQLKFLMQEERIVQVKNQGGVPTHSLSEIGARAGELVDAQIAYAGRSIFTPHCDRSAILQSYENSRHRFGASAKSFLATLPVVGVIRDRIKFGKVQTQTAGSLGCSILPSHRLDHHLCHASTAIFGSGRAEKKLLVLTCDGSGDGISATVSTAENGAITQIANTSGAASIGRLYANITFLLGMVPLEHEYKLMGLAPYAENAGEARNIARSLQSLFQFSDSGLSWTCASGVSSIQSSLPLLEKLCHRKRFDHVAAGAQLFLEEFLLAWVQNCIRQTGIHDVVVSGGVFMNVKANQKILALPEVENLFVFPSCGDETNAIGAAYSLWHKLTGRLPEPLGHLYLGDEFSNDQIEKAIAAFKFAEPVLIAQQSDIEKEVAQLLARGVVVARFKGRMEFGARALGNRSILANPSKPHVVRIINAMIKARDFWMPFAPSVRSEDTERYFIREKGISLPYMAVTTGTRPEKRDYLRAAIHPYDDSARPQEVFESWNPEYHRLLSHYCGMTGESAILNTSFNLHGYPVVHTPSNALEVFVKSDLTHLALGDFLLSKR